MDATRHVVPSIWEPWAVVHIDVRGLIRWWVYIIILVLYDNITLPGDFEELYALWVGKTIRISKICNVSCFVVVYSEAHI